LFLGGDMSINKLIFTYVSKSQTEFIIDDDINFNGLNNLEIMSYAKFVICYDDNVENHYNNKIFEALKRYNKPIIEIPLTSSEKTKSLSFYRSFIKMLEDSGCTKFDLIIAVGGGTIIDLVSFAVSTYMRGLPLMLVPSTLIGQVDASTAGKTCLNTESAKNKLGTFYYPKIVYNNVNFLTTQSYYHFRQGLSEILKYGLLESLEIIETLNKFETQHDLVWLTKIVELTIDARIKICKIDALASNLGHTFGHAIESLSNYQVLHGDAINVGTVMALHYSLQMGIIEQSVLDNVMAIMKKLKLNLYINKDFNPSTFVKFMQKDKKSSSDYLYLVLIKDIAKPYESNGSRFYKVNPREIESFIDKFLTQYEYSTHDYLNQIVKLEP
jgi:3-dehydroquinate synthase